MQTAITILEILCNSVNELVCTGFQRTVIAYIVVTLKLQQQLIYFNTLNHLKFLYSLFKRSKFLQQTFYFNF